MKRLPVSSPLPTAHPLRLPHSITASRRATLPSRSASVLQVGAQIKALRVSAGTSSGELARSSGVSRSMLSRIERGLVSPSLETLERIAGGLHVSASRFFVEDFERSSFCHVPAGSGIQLDRAGSEGGARYVLLGHLLSGNICVEPHLVRLDTLAEPLVVLPHPALKFVHFLSGRARYRCGLKLTEVAPGDSLLFDASAAHGIDAIVEAPVSCLSLSVMLRA